MNFRISTSRRQQLFLSDYLKVVSTTVSSENATFPARIISVYLGSLYACHIKSRDSDGS